MSAGLSPADIDVACTMLIEQIRTRRLVPESELAAVVPTDHSDPYAWLSCYGQIRVWLAGAGASASAKTDDQAVADALVTSALREVAIPVPGLDGVAVYPKSFDSLLQIRVLDKQLEMLTFGALRMLSDEATLDDADRSARVAAAVSYVMHLLVWAWTTEGPGLPFKPTDAAPEPPASITELTPAQILEVTKAAHQFGQSLAAFETLIDPVPARDGGRRPSWAVFFEAVGSATHLDPTELAVTHSLSKVLSLAHLASDRLRPRSDEESH